MIGCLAQLGAAALTPRRRAFDAALLDPAAAQARVRARVEASLRGTAREGRFADLAPQTWDELAPLLARQQAGEPALTTEPVLFWEPTSGSTSAPKFVPYTPSLRRAMTSMFAVWAADLLRFGPRFRTGRMWFSVTPRLDGDGGTADDRDFLDGWVGALFRPFFLSPPGAATLTDPEAWRRAVASFLAADPCLEVISVWSPTLLLTLLDWMSAHRDELPRGALIGDWRALWPELKLVSCWDAGSSAAGAARLRALLPGALVQGKGLLATEAPITVPRHDLAHPLPLVDVVVVELLRDDGELLPIERVEVGMTGEVVLSQTAGLARYRLGDVVEAVDGWGATPGLRLLGRRHTVDLVGEKLTEAAVLEAFAAAGVEVATLVARVDHYELRVDAIAPPEGLAERLEAALCRGHHYRLARALGQLGPVVAVAAPGMAAREIEAGRQWGGVKRRVLVDGGG